MKVESTETREADAPSSRKHTGHEEERALVQRVLATPGFSRSTFLTNFLTYVCECKLQGRDDEITEYRIGIQALGRTDAFHTGEDNIVRNYARILRKRLEEYFAGAGRQEALRIAIPRGHYVPVFETNTLTQPEVTSQALAPDPPTLSVKSEHAPAQTPSSRRWWWAVAALPILAFGVFRAYHVQAATPYVAFWNEMADPNRATFIIPADSGVGILQDLTGEKVDLNDYVAGNMQKQFANFNIAEPGKGDHFGADRFANFTSTADLAIVIGLIRLPQLSGDRVKVRYARDIRMEDLKRSNAVLIGGPRANPWVGLFEPESNFKMEFPMHLDGMHLDERLIVNKHPRAGELTVYTNKTADGTHRTYTVVSFLPSLNGIGHTLLLQGQNMAGTQAAGDFVMDEAAMTPILNKARQSDGSIGTFEVLLETRTVGANAPEAHVMVERYGQPDSRNSQQ